MNTSFTIFTSIDLRAGKVVRLAQGDPSRLTSYADDPLFWAERWKFEGAEWLHVVNLDGAFGEDSGLNFHAMRSIIGIGLNVEFGGGIRDPRTIEEILTLGVKRVFLGTAAIQKPDLVKWAIGFFGPGKIAGDIGARDGKVTTRGWQETTSLSIIDVGNQMKSLGIELCVLTNIKRDGMGEGVDIANAVELQNNTGLKVVASGGVNSLLDVQSARKTGLAGLIIGRALYEGRLSLRECFLDQPSGQINMEQSW